MQVTDSTAPTPETATTALSLNISPTLAVATMSLPGATVGVAYSASLQASGGTPPYSWAITSGALPSGISLSSGGVISGTPSAAATSNFTVRATDSTAPTPETATGTLSLTVDLGPPSTAGSPNWSGYVLGNGPYTAVQGTFNVPSIYASSTNTDTAEWVGIDGATNTSLIQAGIDEPYDASTNTYTIYAWWEILPAAETPISMTVSPGDSISVAIGQVSGTLWGITVSDNTTGATFTIDETYTGPLASVEWIVEAPTLNGAVETLGGYSPDVTCRNLSLTGPQNSLTEWIMVQNSVQVSTHSALAGW
ncbi:MAG: G1 family glutamic endopeptidase [Candidatus Dormibacteria bacterium]